MSQKTVELREALDSKRAALAEVFAQAGPEYDMEKVTTIEGDSVAKVERVRAMNGEIETASKVLSDHLEMERMADATKQDDAPTGRPRFEAKGERREEPPAKTLGELFTDSDAVKLKQGPVGPAVMLDVSLKTLFATTAGWAPETTRGPRVLDFVTRPVQVTDTIPSSTTNQTAIKYMEETTFTNAAAEVAEAGLKPEAALALTERTDPVQKIAVWLPVTDEQLEDVPGIQAYVNGRLTFMVKQRLDTQILVGDGTAPNLSGILDRSGLQTQAKGGDSTPDAIYKAMTKVRIHGSGNGGAIPNVVYMHPNDWQQIRLLTTTDGIYIWGPPMDAGPERIWGVQVVLAEGLTEGTGLTGDTTFTQLFVKKGVEVQVTNSHSDYFIYNKQAIRAEMRVALAVYRPAAFASITGI